MPLVKNLLKLGDSKAVVLPKPFLEQLGLTDAHAEVELTLEKGRIIVAPHRYATSAEFTAAADRVFAKRRGALRKLAKR